MMNMTNITTKMIKEKQAVFFIFFTILSLITPPLNAEAQNIKPKSPQPDTTIPPTVKNSPTIGADTPQNPRYVDNTSNSFDPSSTPCHIHETPAAQQADKKARKVSQIEWMDNYETAIQIAAQKHLPLFLYFTGSDWCGWCKKLDREVLNTKEFGDAIRDKFIFLRLEYPVYSKLSDTLTKQNQSLKEKYDIRGFPTVLLLTKDLKRIATINYRPGGARPYAEFVMRTLQDYDSFQEDIQKLPTDNSKSLKKMYEKSTELGMDEACQKILKIGLQQEDNLFFLKEQYRLLVIEGMLLEPQTLALRQELLGKDPLNQQFTHLDVAVIDFEAHAENLSEAQNANLAIEPLQGYLARFGEQDTQNRWRIEMTISQVLQSKQQYKEAVRYAKNSLEHAPTEMHEEIAKAFHQIKKEAESFQWITEAQDKTAPATNEFFLCQDDPTL